jgi:hypothetical protein
MAAKEKSKGGKPAGAKGKARGKPEPGKQGRQPKAEA